MELVGRGEMGGRENRAGQGVGERAEQKLKTEVGTDMEGKPRERWMLPREVGGGVVRGRERRATGQSLRSRFVLVLLGDLWSLPCLGQPEEPRAGHGHP